MSQRSNSVVVVLNFDLNFDFDLDCDCDCDLAFDSAARNFSVWLPMMSHAQFSEPQCVSDGGRVLETVRPGVTQGPARELSGLGPAQARGEAVLLNIGKAPRR